MDDVLAVLVAAGIGLPLLGALVASSARGTTLARAWAVAAGCGLGAVVLAAAVVVARLGHPLPAWGPVGWLPGWGAGDVVLGLRFDAVAVSLVCSALVSLAILAYARARSEGVDAAFAGTLSVVAGLASCGIVAAVDLAQVLACGMIASFATYLVAGGLEGRMPIGVPARRVLIVHLFGDGLLVLGLLLVWTRIGTLEVDALRGGPGTALSAFLDVRGDGTFDARAELLARRAIAGLFGFAAFGWIAARAACFPFFGWSHDAARLPIAAAGLPLAVLAPCAAVTFLRFTGAFSVANELDYVAAMTGGLTALLAGLSAAFQPNARSALGLASAALLGTAVAGLGTGGTAAIGGASLLVVLGPLTAVGWAAIACAEAGPASGVRRLPDRIVAGSGAVLVSGVFGQNAIVEAMLRGEGGGPIPAVLLLAGTGATAFALVRVGVLLQRPPADESLIVLSTRRTEETPRANVVLEIGVAALVVAAAALVLDGWWPGRVAELVGATRAGPVFGFGVATLAAVPGAVAAWLLRRADLAEPAAIVSRAGALGRMGRQRFHLDDALQLFVSLPLRGLAQVCRFVDWFVLDGLVVGLPRILLGAADAAFQPIREGDRQIGVLTLVLALAVLSAVVLWR